MKGFLNTSSIQEQMHHYHWYLMQAHTLFPKSAYMFTHLHEYPISYIGQITSNLVCQQLKVSPLYVHHLPMNEPVVINGVTVILLEANQSVPHVHLCMQPIYWMVILWSRLYICMFKWLQKSCHSLFWYW